MCIRDSLKTVSDFQEINSNILLGRYLIIYRLKEAQSYSRINLYVMLQFLYTLFEMKRKKDSLIVGNFNFVSAFFARQQDCYKGGNYCRRIGKRREHTRGLVFFTYNHSFLCK